jgi:SNF2 family DNA or RNA helicase
VVQYLDTHRGIIVIHDVGTGKTLTAVAASQCFLSQTSQTQVIVVTPLSLQHNFEQTMDKYGMNSADKKRIHLYTIQGFVNAVKKQTIPDARQCMLILDEAHNIRTDIGEDGKKGEKGEKGVNGVVAKHFIQFASKAQRVMLLTATPMINEPQDLVNLMAMVNGTELAVSRKTDFYDLDYKQWLKQKVSIYSPSVAFTTARFPKAVNDDIFIPMTPDYLVRYMELEQSVKKQDKVYYSKIRQQANRMIETRESPKADWIVRHIKKKIREINYKCVVFSHFIESGLNEVMRQLKRLNIPTMYVSGTINKANRHKAVLEYNSDKIRVLLISKAGGEGLDLKNTTDVILMEPAWNESTNKQVIGRGIRMDSHATLPPSRRVVHVFRLFLVKPTEVPILKTACDKLWLKNENNHQSKLSIDLYLRNLSITKQQEMDRFLIFMGRYSIEHIPNNRPTKAEAKQQRQPSPVVPRLNPRQVSVKKTRTRCPNGSRKNKKTGKCDLHH